VHKIYAELVFLENFIVDLLIIFLAALLTGSKPRLGRFLVSAAAGGVYASAAFGTDFAGSEFVKLAAGIAMCVIAFYVKGERGFWKNTCAFFVTAFVLAGAVYAFSGLSRPSAPAPPQAADILFGTGSGAALAALLCVARKKAFRHERRIAALTLEYRGKKVSARAFIDTGNMLAEPLSGRDVIIVSRAVARALFGKDLALLTGLSGAEATERLRAVPYAAATGTGVMFGLEADGVSLRGSAGRIKAVVCVSGEPLAHEALAGTSLMDKLTGGLVYDEADSEQDNGMADNAHRPCGADRLYKRQRRAPAPADAAGGDGTAGVAGQR